MVGYLLRVSLPDRPGALGHVAGALGLAGVDIQGLTVVDHAGPAAVDDIFIRLPAGMLPERVHGVLAQVPEVRVESLQRWDSGRSAFDDELDFLDSVAADPAAGLSRLVDDAPLLFRSDWAVLLTPRGVTARSAAAPDATPATDWLPIGTAGAVPPEIWPAGAAGADVEQVAAPLRGAAAALVVGRRGGPVYRPAEVFRLAHLTSIVTTLVDAAAEVTHR